jgi:hypothetical protein
LRFFRLSWANGWTQYLFHLVSCLTLLPTVISPLLTISRSDIVSVINLSALVNCGLNVLCLVLTNQCTSSLKLGADKGSTCPFHFICLHMSVLQFASQCPLFYDWIQLNDWIYQEKWMLF